MRSPTHWRRVTSPRPPTCLWTYLKLQWIKGTTYLKGLWAEFTQYISDVWADSAYAIGDVLIGALSGLAGVWNSTLGFMADGWTILTSAVQKGWNNTIGFLKKGFLKLHELVDIAGDVSVQIGGVLINALAGVEKAWVETVDYLADTWTVFVGQVKSMWNSTVGFLKKAWIKLKGLFDDDINVDVEMAKIDADTRAADAARSNSVNKRSLSGNSVDRNASSRSKPTASRCRRASPPNSKHGARLVKVKTSTPTCERSTTETDAKNAVVDQSKEQQFRENDAAQANRQQMIDDTTAGVQSTLDQMRAEAKAAREAARPNALKIAARNATSKSPPRKPSSTPPLNEPTMRPHHRTDVNLEPDDAAPPKPPVAPPNDARARRSRHSQGRSTRNR